MIAGDHSWLTGKLVFVQIEKRESVIVAEIANIACNGYIYYDHW